MKNNLPQNWILSTLGDVCTQPQYGYTTSGVQQGNLRLLRTTDITSGKIHWPSVPFCEVNPEDENKYLLCDGDIVISRAGSVGVSYLVKNPEKSVFASYLIRFKPYINTQFFKYFLESPFYWKQISENKLGIAVPNVNASKLQTIPIPVAPANEQKRIVAKIEELFSELDKGIESLKTARVQLKVYRQAVLKHAFEGKLTADWREKNGVSGEWEVAEIGKCGKWQGGGTPSKSVLEYWENGNISWVSPKDMKSRYINNTQQKITEKGVENSPAKKTLDRAVLFVVRSGILRRILPVAMAVSGVTVNQDMQAVVPSRHTVEFMYWYCEAHEQDIRHECSKDGTTVESIEVAELKKFPIPVPSLEEQKEVVREIETQVSVIEQIEHTIESELVKSESLRQAILKKAFSGELVAQDPNDEPASVLLERIRAEKESQSPQRKTKRGVA